MTESAAKPPDWHAHYQEAARQLTAATKALSAAQTALKALSSSLGSGFGASGFGESFGD